MLFTLADRWGEPDPRKLAAMPANILTYWEAYFGLLRQEQESPPVSPPPRQTAPEQDAAFADCLRVLGHG